MEKILQLIYDKSINNKTLDLNDIEKILELLITNKKLNEYVLNIKEKQRESKKLASYSIETKEITIYSNTIELMLNNIEKKIKIDNYFEIELYKNLSILQIVLHEIEHANQQKIMYKENNLEAFILRLSNYYDNNSLLYEYSPAERLAEIKSFEELILLINLIKNKVHQLFPALETEKNHRLLRGYHYQNNNIDSPLITYFCLSNKEHILKAFEWYNDDYNDRLKQVCSLYHLKERLIYGFPITMEEYLKNMKNLVVSTNKNFEKRILIKK